MTAGAAAAAATAAVDEVARCSDGWHALCEACTWVGVHRIVPDDAFRDLDGHRRKVHP